jgi:hypothetical protein
MFRDDKPLWMPEGSVRATLAYVCWGLCSYLLVTGTAVPEELWTLSGVVTAFYFAAGPARAKGDERD